MNHIRPRPPLRARPARPAGARAARPGLRRRHPHRRRPLDHPSPGAAASAAATTCPNIGIHLWRLGPTRAATPRRPPGSTPAATSSTRSARPRRSFNRPEAEDDDHQLAAAAQRARRHHPPDAPRRSRPLVRHAGRPRVIFGRRRRRLLCLVAGIDGADLGADEVGCNLSDAGAAGRTARRRRRPGRASTPSSAASPSPTRARRGPRHLPPRLPGPIGGGEYDRAAALRDADAGQRPSSRSRPPTTRRSSRPSTPCRRPAAWSRSPPTTSSRRPLDHRRRARRRDRAARRRRRAARSCALAAPLVLARRRRRAHHPRTASIIERRALRSVPDAGGDSLAPVTLAARAR